MTVRFSTHATDQLSSQLEYLLSKGAIEPARALRHRVLTFADDFLAVHPKAGTYIPERDIFEIWIPRTRFVLLYRIENDRDVRILALFHSSQDRARFEADNE